MSNEYNVMIDLGEVAPDDVDLDAMAEYHAVLAAGAVDGHLELIITLHADDLRQAVSTALTVTEARLSIPPFAVRALSTAGFDAGLDVLDQVVRLTVGQAADLLGVTTAAVRQRLDRGTIPGRRLGRDWLVNARLANLYTADGELVARVHVPAGQHPIVHDGVRYVPTGGGHSVGEDPIAYSYVPA